METDNSTPKPQRKVCPLKSAGPAGRDCDEERCAWWLASECAAVIIAANISDMRDVGILAYQP